MTSCRGEHVNLKIQLLTLQLPKCFCFYLCFLLKLPVLWWTHSRNVPKSVLSRAWVLVFDSEVGTRCNSHVFLGPLEKANIRSVSVATELDLPSFGNFCWQGHASTEFGKTDLVVQRHHSTDAWIMQRYYKDALPTFNITPTGKNRFPTIIFQGLVEHCLWLQITRTTQQKYLEQLERVLERVLEFKRLMWLMFANSWC